VLSVAGDVAFFLLPAVFPADTACISICGLLADPAMIAAHLDDLSSVLAADAVKIVADQAVRLISAGDARR
jgi:membrane protein